MGPNLGCSNAHQNRANSQWQAIYSESHGYEILSIRQLTEELDPDQFWRIHRGSIINVSQIAGVSRSFAGRLFISLKNLPETLTVSRSYANLFKQM